jgi:hypothetical protein
MIAQFAALYEQVAAAKGLNFTGCPGRG